MYLTPILGWNTNRYHPVHVSCGRRSLHCSLPWRRIFLTISVNSPVRKVGQTHSDKVTDVSTISHKSFDTFLKSSTFLLGCEVVWSTINVLYWINVTHNSNGSCCLSGKMFCGLSCFSRSSVKVTWWFVVEVGVQKQQYLLVKPTNISESSKGTTLTEFWSVLWRPHRSDESLQ